MDSYAGRERDNERMSACDFEAPPLVRFDERRMHVRAYNYWAGLLHGKTLPSIEDLDPQELDDFGAHSILLDFTAGVSNPAISYVGAALLAECDITDKVAYVSDVPARTLLSRLTDHFLQIIANAVPIGFEAEFTNQRGADILYRGILMPFSSDGDSIDFIYGVINWKEVAATELTDRIAAEVASVLDEMTVTPPGQTMAAWADGPLVAPADPAFDATQWNTPQANPADPERSGVDAGEPLAFRPLDGAIAGPKAADLAAALASSAEVDETLLADVLALARSHVAAVTDAEGRTRGALYLAISAAHDLALVAAQAPGAYAALLEEAGIVLSPRSPATALVKLCFGARYDKTRIAEYALILDHAQAHGIAAGGLAAYLARYPGGLKALIAAQRAAKRGGTSQSPRTPRARLRLASQPPINPLFLPVAEDGLVVVVGRVEADGSFAALAALAASDRLADRVIARATRPR